MRTKGWQSVLKFTLIQYIKTKSFIIGTVIMCLIVAAVCVLTNVLPVALGADEAIEDLVSEGDGSGEGTEDGEGGEDESLLDFATVYINDRDGILTDEDINSLKTSVAVLTPTDKTLEEMQAMFKENTKTEDENQPSVSEAFLEILTDKDDDGIVTGYNISVVYSADGENDAETLSYLAEELVSRRNMFSIGVSEENYQQSQAYISSRVVKADSETIDFFTSIINYIVPMILSLALFVMIFSYGSTVAQSIATEKTSRVMELLLTSVRPLAVVIGKVLAMAIVSLGQSLLILTVGGISLVASAPFGIAGKLSGIMNNPDFAGTITQSTDELAAAGLSMDDIELAQAVGGLLENFSPLNIILILIVFLLGFLFFSLIAALVGASISRMEDLTTAMQPYSFMGIIGFYLAYFPVIFNVESLDAGVSSTNPIQLFSYYFPLSSPFALPSAILLGIFSPIQSVIAVLVLAACVVLVAILVSKVYEAIVLHNGNRIKLSDMIKMATRK